LVVFSSPLRERLGEGDTVLPFPKVKVRVVVFSSPLRKRSGEGDIIPPLSEGRLGGESYPIPVKGEVR